MRLFGFPLGVRQPPRSTARCRLLHTALGLSRPLRRYDRQGWRATFFPSEFEHSLIPTPEARGRGARGKRSSGQRQIRLIGCTVRSPRGPADGDGRVAPLAARSSEPGPGRLPA
jgi:hypothetical protein